MSVPFIHAKGVVMESSKWVRRLGLPALVVAGAAIGAVVISPVAADSGGGNGASAAAVKYSPPIVRYIRSAKVTIANGADGSAIAQCPSLFRATGGGGAYPAAPNVQVLQSVPSNGASQKAGRTAWEFRIRNGSGFPRDIRAYVICVKTRRVGGNYTPGSAVL
jgi:hypothetical protein